MDTLEQTVRIRELTDADRDRWDAFVLSCPEASFFHRAGWKTVVERSFGHPTRFLYAERRGEIVGVLPLVQVKSRLFGNALVSTAFCMRGGPAAVDGVARAALDARAAALAEELDVDHLEYRADRLPDDRWRRKSGVYANFRRPIDRDPEKNLAAIPRKQRAVVRKALKSDLRVEIDEDSGRLYDVYAVSVRNLGTPVFPRRYFQTLKDVFGADCDIVTVCLEGRPVSSVMNFHFRGDVMPYYGGGTPEARAVGANDLMYWEVMRRAAERGERRFDFGRSKVGTGAFDFKKNWGFEPEPLDYVYLLRRGGAVPDLNPLNPKYRFFVALWKRLPLPLANLAGPVIAGSLG